MKALYCMRCGTIASPHPDGAWRVCDCRCTAIRWTDAAVGHSEVWTCIDPAQYVRVIGLNNLVLTMSGDAVKRLAKGDTDEGWRQIHETSTELVGDNYLFHRNRRNCWAVIFTPGETGDVKLLHTPDLPDGADG